MTHSKLVVLGERNSQDKHIPTEATVPQNVHVNAIVSIYVQLPMMNESFCLHYNQKLHLHTVQVVHIRLQEQLLVSSGVCKQFDTLQIQALEWSGLVKYQW